MSPTPPSEAAAKNALIEAILRHSFLRGRFQLASGAWSDYYLDLRRTTLDPAGLAAAVAALWGPLAGAGVSAVGGPTLGADPLVAGLILEAGRRGEPIQGFLVRSAVKDHGTARAIEGHCAPGARVAILDDVVTRGGSILRAVDAARAAGAEPVLTLALVDREEGGREALAKAGVELFTPLRVSEVLEAASARGM